MSLCGIFLTQTIHTAMEFYLSCFAIAVKRHHGQLREEFVAYNFRGLVHDYHGEDHGRRQLDIMLG